MASYELLEEALLAASTRAVAYLRSSFARGRTVGVGYGGDVQREFDLVSESIIAETLRSYLGDVRLVSEESGVSGEGSWIAVVDPVDGSLNLEAGIPIAAVSIGLARNRPGITVNDIEAAVVAEVFRDVIYYSDKRRGFKSIGLPVGRKSPPSSILLGYFESFESFRPYTNFTRTYAPGVRLRSLGSAALDIIYVALGAALGFVDSRAKLRNVDVAASIHIASNLGAAAYVCDGRRAEDLEIDKVVRVECLIVGYDERVAEHLLKAVRSGEE